MLAVLPGDARPPDLDPAGHDLFGEAREVELAVAVEARPGPRHVGGLHPIGADDGVGLGVDDQQVVAVGVELVAVEAVAMTVLEALAQLEVEDLVAEPEGLVEVGRGGGEAHLVAPLGESRGGDDPVVRERTRTRSGCGRLRHGIPPVRVTVPTRLGPSES